jgi:DNA uptake protein ComE-like DNA-binding protein
MDKKKSQKQTNIEQNLGREVREDFRNVKLWVKHYDIYNRWRKLRILGSKTKDQL